MAGRAAPRGAWSCALACILVTFAAAALAAIPADRAEIGVTVHRLWIYAHLLLFVFWLGADLGVFICSRAVVRPGLAPEQMLRTAGLMRAIELAPRMAASLMLTVGGVLTEYVGIPHPWWQMAGIVLLGPVWLALVLIGYARDGTPLGEIGVKLDVALRALLVAAVPMSVAWSWSTGRLDPAPYVAVKLLIFAALMLAGLVLRYQLRPFSDGLRRLAAEQPDAGRVREIALDMTASHARTRFLVIAIWIGLALAALMGVTKPGAPAESSPVETVSAVTAGPAPLPR